MEALGPGTRAHPVSRNFCASSEGLVLANARNLLPWTSRSSADFLIDVKNPNQKCRFLSLNISAGCWYGCVGSVPVGQRYQKEGVSSDESSDDETRPITLRENNFRCRNAKFCFAIVARRGGVRVAAEPPGRRPDHGVARAAQGVLRPASAPRLPRHQAPPPGGHRAHRLTLRPAPCLTPPDPPPRPAWCHRAPRLTLRPAPCLTPPDPPPRPAWCHRAPRLTLRPAPRLTLRPAPPSPALLSPSPDPIHPGPSVPPRPAQLSPAQPAETTQPSATELLA